MKRPDWTIVFGISLGAAAIVVGAWLDGLNISFLLHPTAALIVFGGTLGAVIVRRGGTGVTGAIRAVTGSALRGDEAEERRLELSKLAWLSRSAQKNGFKAYESFADTSRDTLVARGLRMVADRTDREHLERTLGRELEKEMSAGLQHAATLEAAGAFAPTFGIIGAVLGLIAVLRVLDKPEALGVGIATAFVATLYGIGIANLLLFPLAARLKSQHEERMRHREELASVIVALADRESPISIANRFNLKK
jgi:chemotaxis protein MotA